KADPAAAHAVLAAPETGLAPRLQSVAEDAAKTVRPDAAKSAHAHVVARGDQAAEFDPRLYLQKQKLHKAAVLETSLHRPRELDGDGDALDPVPVVVVPAVEPHHRAGTVVDAHRRGPAVGAVHVADRQRVRAGAVDLDVGEAHGRGPVEVADLAPAGAGAAVR